MTLIAAGLVAAGVSLGRWQLARAAQKEALQAEIEAQKKQPPLSSDEFMAMQPATDSMHRPVRLRGLWLPTHTVYLDNRQMHGVPGFYVLTPFALEGSDQTVLIQRGWVQRNFNDRTQLMPVSTPSGLVEIVGTIAPAPSHLLDLSGPGKPNEPASADGGARATSSSPPAPAASSASGTSAPASGPTGVSMPAAPGPSAIRQNLDLAAFRAETKLPLRTDVTLQQAGPASEGLQRDWPAPALGVEKHYGYAFQWFGLAALVVILYVWFQFIAPFRRSRRARHG